MFDLTSATKERHERFIQRVVASREVWGLKSADGWVVSTSTASGYTGRSIMPFWSDQAYAKQCAKEDWARYEPTSIPLDFFWSVGWSAWRQMAVLSAPTGTRRFAGMRLSRQN